MANATRITSRQRLSALYAKGCGIRFTRDGVKLANHEDPPGSHRFVFTDEDHAVGDDGVEMWVASPNPFHREQALRDAQAARARALLRVKQNPDSEEYLTARAFLADLSLDSLIDYVILSDSDARTNDAIRSVLAEPEWENFDELRDAMRQYEEAVDRYEETEEGDDPREAEEWADLLAADARYSQQVSARERELVDSARESLALVGREELERRALEKRSELIGSQAFMAEYEDQMRYYSAREPENTDRLFFASVQEYREIDEIVQNAIGEALKTFINEVGEAKN